MRGNSLRIATWNIASNKNFSAIASRTAELDIDICAMQEVSFDPMVDLPAMFGHADRSAARTPPGPHSTLDALASISRLFAPLAREGQMIRKNSTKHNNDGQHDHAENNDANVSEVHPSF